MKTREDFKPDSAAPRSIREIVAQELSYTTYDGKSDNPLAIESVDQLLHRVYEHIQNEALRLYKSNALWAVKAYCYDHILSNAVAKEAALCDETLLDELASPVQDWATQHFDPLVNIKRKLEASEYAPGYISQIVKLAREMVLRYGKKQRYTEPEILDYLEHLKKTYRSSTYATKVYQLKVFIDSLPADKQGRKEEIPLKRFPAYPSEYHQPSFTREDLEALAATALVDEHPESVLRLLIAEIYGVRLGELTALDSKYININHGEPTITFLVQKRKIKRFPVTQPIPKELTPFFAIPIKPRKPHQVLSDLRRLCRKAGIRMPYRAGVHSIRRRLVTDLWETPGIKELSIRNFIRWSTSSQGMLPRYVQKSTLQTDAEVLAQHPYSWWKEWACLVPSLPQYENVHTIDFN